MSSPKPQAGTQQQSLLGIEVARFVCAIAVLIWHYQHFWFTSGTGPFFDRTQQPLYPSLKLFYDHGSAAVQVFWCISGFIFFRNYAQKIAAGGVPAGRFVWLRFSRLYPLHLLTLLLTALLQWRFRAVTGSYFVYAEQNAYHFLLQLLMASSWGLEAGYSYNGPIWSVSVEVLIYAVFFVSCRLRLVKPWAVGLLLMGAFSLRMHSEVTSCGFYFFLGAATSILYGWLDQRLSLRTQALLFGAVCLFLVSALYTDVVRLPANVRPAAYLTPPFLLLLLATVRPKSDALATFIVRLGNTTYSSYLIHFPLQLSLVLAFARHQSLLPFQRPWFLIAFLLLTIVLGEAVYRLFERPAQDWLRTLSIVRTPPRLPANRVVETQRNAMDSATRPEAPAGREERAEPT